MRGTGACGDGPMKRRKPRRWLRRAAAGVLVAGCVVAGGLWLGLRHVPAWYRPVRVPPEQLQRVRDDLADKFREVSDRIVGGEPFEVTLTDRMVSQWIAARGQIWPDSQGWIPLLRGALSQRGGPAGAGGPGGCLRSR